MYLCWTRRTSGSESEGDLCSSPPPSLVGAWCGQVVSDFGIRRGLSPNFFLRLHTFTFRGPLQRAVQQRLRASSSSSSSHLPACHTDNTCTVTPALHSSNCIASNHHSHRQEQEMQRETTSAARTLHCSWNALSSPASHRRLFALSLPIVFFAVHFAAGATFFAALPLLIDAFSLYKSYFLYFYFFLGRIWSSFVRSVRLDQLKIGPQFIQHNKGSTEKNPFFFRNKS